ncbi:MAG: AraC family transcriptional regulator [Chromatiales bacterium]
MDTPHHDQESEIHDTSSESVDAHNGSDPLSDVLDTIRLSGALFFLWEPRWPYGTGVAEGRRLSQHIVPGADRVISYHIVTKGPCWGAVEGEQPVRLETGDILVLPQGDAYKISNDPQYPTEEDKAASIAFFQAMAAGDIPPVVTTGGPGPQVNRLICGFLGCDMRPFNPLLSSLPRMIRIPAPGSGSDPLSSLIEFALSESGKKQGGERCLLMRLSEVMFVEVLRRYLCTKTQNDSGWLEGLRDPLVGRALGLLHKSYGESWTLEKMARQVGASRSTLADKFTHIVGIPPMQYLLQWRMQIAAGRLAGSSAKLYAIAREVGYESETTFSRAFKRVTGQTPKAWRDRCNRVGD